MSGHGFQTGTPIVGGRIIFPIVSQKVARAIPEAAGVVRTAAVHQQSGIVGLRSVWVDPRHESDVVGGKVQRWHGEIAAG